MMNNKYSIKEQETKKYIDTKQLTYKHDQDDGKKIFLQNEFDTFNISNSKFFLIKSPNIMDEIKMIVYVCEEYDYERILFLTYKNTVGYDTMQTLNDHNFADCVV